ncbi:MAG: hypothetical protein KAW45_02590 [Thermoplasmatales archaeon]|nr:hypothetical protein [Thermoplasmatales archaeon]
MFKLRFYLGETDSRREKNKQIISLLQEIKKRHNIDYEIFRLRITKNGYVDEKHEKEIYENHFKPRAKVLKKRIGESLPRTLRSQRGRGHYYVSGTIAILEDGQIGWYTCWKSCKRFEKFDKDSEVSFLKVLISQGPKLLKELCPDISALKSPHDFLIDEFIRVNPLQGKIEREVKVGSMVSTNKYGSIFDWRKAIDLVAYTDQAVWIIEVKPKLNWEAFGQVIAYAHLFQKEQLKSHIQKGIVCKKSDPEILAICKEFNVKVFMWQEGEFKLVSVKQKE